MAQSHDSDYYSLLYSGPEHEIINVHTLDVVKKPSESEKHGEESDTEFFDSVAWQELLESGTEDESEADVHHGRVSRAVHSPQKKSSVQLPDLLHSLPSRGLTLHEEPKKKQSCFPFFGCCKMSWCSKKKEDRDDSLHSQLFGSESSSSGQRTKQTEFSMAQ